MPKRRYSEHRAMPTSCAMQGKGRRKERKVCVVFFEHTAHYLVHPLVRLWHKVPEADGGEGDEAEVCRVQRAPSLPLAEEDGAANHVAHHQHAADPQRDLV